MINRRHNTWIQEESIAYNVPLTKSKRRGLVEYEGKLIKVYLGIPDTFFTIPAFYRNRNKRIHGYVAISDDKFVFHSFQ